MTTKSLHSLAAVSYTHLAQDQHMLGHPALVFAQVRGDTESEALFAQQNVSAVAGVYRDNSVVLREVHDISLLSVNVAFAVEAVSYTHLEEKLDSVKSQKP